MVKQNIQEHAMKINDMPLNKIANTDLVDLSCSYDFTSKHMVPSTFLGYADMYDKNNINCNFDVKYCIVNSKNKIL